MSFLFNSISIRSITVKNRIFVSPMCQYFSATKNRLPTEGHTVHLGSRAIGGAGVLTGAVGMIDEPNQTEQILAGNHSDAVFIGRELLRNPYWPMYTKSKLDGDASWPDQYLRVIQ